jgi:hypothetical protein
MAANKVSMEVGLKNIFNGCFSLSGKIQISFNVSEGINYGSLTIALYEISSFAQAARVKLADEHNSVVEWKKNLPTLNSIWQIQPQSY